MMSDTEELEPTNSVDLDDHEAGQEVVADNVDDIVAEAPDHGATAGELEAVFDVPVKVSAVLGQRSRWAVSAASTRDR